jgi:uncharacterized protein (DUF1778 family)
VSNDTARLDTTQPATWVDAIRKAASLEGVTLSEFVGEACLDRAARITGAKPKDLRVELGERIRRGER